MKPLFMVASLFAMQVEQTIDPASAENFIRYALTQGGLLSLVLVLGWSYRRDFMRIADLRAERIGILTELVAKSTEAQTQSSSALLQCSTALATQAQSIQSMSQVLGELKGALLGRRGSDN